MPKRINNIYDKALTFSKIRDAYYRCVKKKKKDRFTIKFETCLEDNIIDIYRSLKSETYKVGKYRSFKITIPKERMIYCLPFYDRVVQQLYVHEYIMPYMLPKFIENSFACIPSKGVHTCINLLQKYMRITKRIWKEPYFVKYDISKFFYSIDRNVLYNIIHKYYKDEKFLKLTKKFIEFVDDGKLEYGKGLPIGNYTSQYFANIYMNELDKFIKEKLKIKYYIRFMDDGIMIVESKEKAKETLINVTNFVENELLLRLNKKTCYMPVRQGCQFCGYRIYNDYKLIKKTNKSRMKKRVGKWNKKYRSKKYNFKKWIQSLNAWKGYAKHADTYNLINSIEKRCLWITK